MPDQNKGILRVGTSGISLPGSKQSFPAAYQSRSRLNYYGSLFNTLEINSTFQKTPMPRTIQKWFAEVPENFRFTLKLSRDITHVKKLLVSLENIDNFLAAASYFGNKKGALLVQFPASITSVYYKEVMQILQRIGEKDLDTEWQKAIEFRSGTWYNNQTYDLLTHFGATLVLHDMPKSNNLHVPAMVDFAYFRFHGPKGDYRGDYTTGFLQEQSQKMQRLLEQGKDVYAYFNNTMGNACDNAQTLIELVQHTTR
jgi:uncharacterized protein YecE (DUF72 family)